ncbi:hypothetical protein IQ268_31250 [Oculatella sp. LEGE 06141]|uniref:hypothetical protein n=1 Tax=Oculatella sp. LEGE 06141 TaxID=1828648 RepID=UPI0018818629|nr:hypothetical protein [Oculatella sp. LEGE 06141]MBE9183014.1 hypothetical protein [Oculatella sp. LEGE 06141]
MNIESLGRLPRLAVGILGLVYALLGWYIADHHIALLVGVAVPVATLLAAWKGVPLLRQWSQSSSQSLLVITAVSLAISLSVILLVTDFQFLGLIFLPLVTMVLADLEMRSAGFNQREIWLYLAAVAGLGIGLGEAIELVIIPGMR